MENENKKEHDSYGMISISRFSGGGCQFYGSDINHSGGFSITISKSYMENKYASKWHYSSDELIEVNISTNQFIDLIGANLNTSGVPCTIKHINCQRIEQIEHVVDKKCEFRNNMNETYEEFYKRIDNILELLSDGNIGKKKQKDLIHEMQILKGHIKSNTDFIMDRFNESMDDTITEAKQNISNYVDHKVQSLGIEAMREELNTSIEPKRLENEKP